MQASDAPILSRRRAIGIAAVLLLAGVAVAAWQSGVRDVWHVWRHRAAPSEADAQARANLATAVNIDVSDVPLSHVLRTIELETGLAIQIESGWDRWLELAEPIEQMTVTARHDGTAGEALAIVCRAAWPRLGFEIRDGRVLVGPYWDAADVEPGDDDFEPLPLAASLARLRRAKFFATGRVGMGLISPPELEALDQLLGSDQAAEALHDLRTHGSPAGQLYALLGLAEVSPDEFASLQRNWRRRTDVVMVMSGSVLTWVTVGQAVRADLDPSVLIP